MINETSFGMIPLKVQDGVWNVFLVKLHSGNHWSFPKGRPNQGETPMETAGRELFEETGLRARRFITEEPLLEKYLFTRNGEQISKVVTYFVAEVEGEVLLQHEEVSEGKWVPLSEAPQHITHSESKNICNQLIKLL